MIKANDLRPGCWIKTVNGYEQVVDVLCDSVNTKTLQNELYDNIEPIELTPVLLRKIGGCEMIHDGCYNLTWELKHRERFITIKYSKPDKTWRVTFVSEIILQRLTLHWLQNVIYYNWGKELSITL